jgi:uncharacterized membrane protein YozB (DUF420 family)
MDLLLQLPAVNAALNAVAASLLVVGRRLARQGRIEAHRRVMLSAFGVSSVFLLFYVLHKLARDFQNTPFNAEGAPKAAYLVLLFTHVILAATVPVFAIALVRLGQKGLVDPAARARHQRLARVAWPVWMYVSVTGVLIYVVLYHLNPAA